jgi:hypothetical protein
MYFAVAAISLILNLVILLSYCCCGVAQANKAALAATTFSWITLIGNLIVWSIAASLYRKEKKTNDLWGWTCGPAARAIQKEFADQVQFNTYCNIQVSNASSARYIIPLTLNSRPPGLLVLHKLVWLS